MEYYGGFPSLKPDSNATFRSSLALNGTVTWSTVKPISSDCNETFSESDFIVSFPEVDFDFLQKIYGWAVLQYQAWARGSIIIHGSETQSIALYTDRVLEFWVDGQHHFGGDFYSYRRAPLVLHLEPGEHRIDVRLVRDVRAMGGIGAPDIQITLRAQAFAPRLQLVAEKALLPDIVGGVLAGSFGSLTVRNHALDDVVITGISADDAGYRAGLAVDDAWLVVSGQTRPIAFNLTCIKTPCPSRVSLTLEYVFAGQHDIATLTVSQVLPERSVREPHKITFLHPGAIVSYAILRPPPLNMSCQPEEHEALPVLLSLHGAGLEADDPLVAHALDPVPDLCAWVLFPTGVTPWSGDDWHAWGFEDVKAAIRAISSWITATGWPGPGVDIERWLVSGHSNGGQGTWYAMAHQPDNIIAAAPVSGYSSIQNYVPFKLWHSMQPAVRAILDGSISSYRHEMLLSNVKGIPVLQQHGSNDDNVPAYHSRLMYQMIHEADASSHYVEFPGQGHWVDGILTTAPLKGFYHEHLNHKSRMKKTSESFCLVVANPADTGSKNGFRILQLVTPGQLGKLNVGVDETHALRVTASNVLCFELRGYRLRQASNVEVDGQRVELPFVDGLRQIELCRGPISRSWQVSKRSEGQLEDLLTLLGQGTAIRVGSEGQTYSLWPTARCYGFHIANPGKAPHPHRFQFKTHRASGFAQFVSVLCRGYRDRR